MLERLDREDNRFQSAVVLREILMKRSTEKFRDYAVDEIWYKNSL